MRALELSNSVDVDLSVGDRIHRLRNSPNLDFDLRTPTRFAIITVYFEGHLRLRYSARLDGFREFLGLWIRGVLLTVLKDNQGLRAMCDRIYRVG